MHHHLGAQSVLVLKRGVARVARRWRSTSKTPSSKTATKRRAPPDGSESQVRKPTKFGYLQVMSDGSSMPMLYASPVPGSLEKQWRVLKNDIYKAPLWQPAHKGVVSSAEEDAVMAFKKKFGLK